MDRGRRSHQASNMVITGKQDASRKNEMIEEKERPIMKEKTGDKNAKGNEKAQDGREWETLFEKIEDLRNTAFGELSSIETLTELGKKAAEDYTYTDLENKLRSISPALFIDWQGMLLIVEEHMEAAKEALQDMDSLIVKTRRSLKGIEG